MEDAISESLIDWIQAAPEHAITKPRPFLYRTAWRNLREIAASELARKCRERAWSAERGRQTSIYEGNDARISLAAYRIEELLPDDALRSVFRLRACGERRTSVYAEALGLDAKSAGEAAALVKREKDRLDKHLRRDIRIRGVAAAALGRE